MTRRRSPYADTPPLYELRERRQPGKCIICYKPMSFAGSSIGTRALSCIGECRMRFLYAQNRAVLEPKTPEQMAARNREARVRRQLRNFVDPNECNPPIPGLPCNLDPRRSMDPTREQIADAELRAWKLNQQEERGAV